jgi:hypothetical protein
VHRELDADLLRQRLLGFAVLRRLELLEQVLDLAMIGLQQKNRVGFSRHENLS